MEEGFNLVHGLRNGTGQYGREGVLAEPEGAGQTANDLRDEISLSKGTFAFTPSHNWT